MVIIEYSIFVGKIVKKGLSLNTTENLGKGWFSGVYVNDQGELNFTDPFTMEIDLLIIIIIIF
ncbi:MAG TPA: hypothetical protein VIZ62_06590 [Nitrososphaeraceae archaeon]